MFHVLKYVFLLLVLFVFVTLFYSNVETMVSLEFKIAQAFRWSSIALPLSYLLFVVFSLGVLFSAFIGAMRLSSLRGKNKELKRLRKNLEEQKLQLNQAIIAAPHQPSLDPDIPSLIQN